MRASPLSREPDDLLRFAARAAFGTLTLKNLKMLADELRVPDRASATKTFDMICLLVRFVLNTSQEETLHIASKRMATLQHAVRSSVADIMALDEGLEVCNKHEVEEIRREQKNATAMNEAVDDFATDFEIAKQQEGARAKRKMVLRPLPEGEVSQQVARTLIPAETSIWRNNAAGGWCGHCPPYARCSALTAIHGSEGAPRQVLKTLWLQRLSLTGEPEAACPWAGLLGPPTAAPDPAAAGSDAAPRGAAESSAAPPPVAKAAAGGRSGNARR